MPRPTLIEQVHYLTTRQVAEELGIGVDTLNRRIAAGMYPPPIAKNEHGVALFNDKWLAKAKPPA